MTGHEEVEAVRLTADVVLMAPHDGELHVLLIQRGWPPFQGRWALPGGHVDPGEDTAVAARRELREETGLALIPADCLRLVGAYAAPGRDPRGRYVTFAYYATLVEPLSPTAGDDATAACWRRVSELTADVLAFDHHQIITDALHLHHRSEPVTVERVGVVIHVGHRTTIHQQPWVILTVEHSGNIETDVLIFPGRIQLADGIGEGDRVRVRGALRYAEDPLAAPAIVAEQLTTVTYESQAVTS